ncbi:hypothetical protein [Cupriavidus basilensis]|uniref:hypothetical protein n=1 Tax=Cupriavidus basilensis TaxID=68895 RepID=UPI001186AD1F|nr:hypothetical protein [Cupriavidus basilensis]
MPAQIIQGLGAIFSKSDSAADKFSLTENRAVKMFGEREGHIHDTPENRELLSSVANDPAKTLGSDRFGNVWSGKTLPNGTQVWTQTRNGQIWNGGINKTPKTFNQNTGLSSPIRPGWK